MRIDIYLHNGDDELLGKLVQIQSSLDALLKRSGIMGATLQDVADKVTAQTDVIKSAETLLTELNTELKAAIANQDMAAVQAISDKIDSNTAELAAAVAANTPAAPTPPAAA